MSSMYLANLVHEMRFDFCLYLPDQRTPPWPTSNSPSFLLRDLMISLRLVPTFENFRTSKVAFTECF